jgi:hypothetical protein
MPRGMRNEPDIDTAISELFGGIKLQIIYFAAETGISAHRVAERVSALLHPERERLLHQMSSMQRETARVRGPVEPLALAQHAHSGEAPLTIEASRSTPDEKGDKPRLKRRSAGDATNPNSYWGKMSPEERRVESARRRRKWTKEAKLKWKGGLGGRRTAKSKKVKSAEQEAKQRVYLARAKAKKEGRPLPPLPGEGAAGSASVQ